MKAADPILSEGAPINRRTLRALLREEATGFEFFQAVRLLERLGGDRAAVGGFSDPRDEGVKFRASPSLAFPGAEIASIDLPAEGAAEMIVNFMGLVGPLGVLPLEYTELVFRQNQAGQPALGDFLNIFEHRLISLFYGAWKRSRVTVGYEERAGVDDLLTDHLFDLLGQGLESFRGHLPFDERTLLSYANLLLAPQRSAVALEQLVSDYFAVPVSVEQFMGQWRPLRVDDQCRIDEDENASNALGLGATLGDEVWDLQSSVRLRIGPLNAESFDRFLPGRPAYQELAALARFYSQDQHDFELCLVLNTDEVRPIVLGEGSPLSLGWSTWIRSRQAQPTRTESVFPLRHRPDAAVETPDADRPKMRNRA